MRVQLPGRAQSAVERGLSEPGRPLPKATQGRLRPQLGFDLSGVRVHDGPRAHAAAEALGARALTTGQHVMFQSGAYTPRLLVHELAHVAQQGGQPGHVQRSGGEAATLGTELEASEVNAWKETLRKQGYTEFHSKQDKFTGWAYKAFPDGRKRPDLIAVNHQTKHILVGDITASPGSPADLKPGDLRKLPNDSGEIETRVHLEKTVDDARQTARHLPDELKEYRVSAQDRYWREGGHSVQVPVSNRPEPPPPRGPGAPPEAPAKPPPAEKVPAQPTQAKPAPAKAAPAKPAAAPKTSLARGTLSKIKGIATFSNVTRVLVVLQGLSALADLAKFTAMTQSALDGKGFLLTKERTLAEKKAAALQSQLTDYEKFSEELGSYGMSFMGMGEPDVARDTSYELGQLNLRLGDSHRELLSQRVRLREVRDEAHTKAKIAEKLLTDPQTSGILAGLTMGTAVQAQIFAAWQDLEHISAYLSTAVAAMDKLEPLLKQDVEFTERWDRMLFDVCLRGGACHKLGIFRIYF